MVHALRNFISSQRGLVILSVALVGITIALPLIYAQTSNTRLVTAGVATDVACAAPCISTAEIVAGAVTGGAAGVISDGTITGADIAALGIDASGDFAAGVVNDAAIATGITVSKLGDTAGITDILFGTASLAAVAIAAGAGQAVTVTITGADITNDVVWCSLETAAADALVLSQATITGANTVTAVVTNASGISVTPAVTDDVFCLVFARP